MPIQLNRKRKDTLLYIAGGAMIAGVLTIMVALVWLRPSPIERDPETLCRSDGPASITAILLDRTDSFGSITEADLNIQIWNHLYKSKENHEIGIFTVDSTQEKTLDPIIKVCNPGDPDKADPLIESEAIIRRKWEQKFREPLEKVLEDLLDEKEAPSSPIMESIQSVSITHFQGTEPKDYTIPRRLIIISDLLQNSDAISFYRERPNFNDFQQRPESRGLNPDLRGVDVEVWLIQRRQSQQGDGGEVLKFFQSWISTHGGQVVRVLRTSGIND